MSDKKRGLEFCCCAIPLINFGSYTICLQFIFVALCVALLAVGPPSIVAATGSLPSGWPKAIVCVLAFIVVAWQIVGLIAIKKEKTKLYRTYIRINFALTILMIIITLAFFAVAAARHSAALDNCTAQYGNIPAGSSSSTNANLTDLGATICNIFIWVQVGFMGLLIILIGLMQLYMCYCQRAYGREMRRAEQDHKTYAGMNSEGIPLANRGSGIWEAEAIPTSFGMRHQNETTAAYASRPDSFGSDQSHDDLHRQQRAKYNEPAFAAHQQPYSSYAPGGGDAARQDTYDNGNYQQGSYDQTYSSGYNTHEQPEYQRGGRY